MKVFLDANILFSASATTSQVARLLAIVQQYGSCVTNSYAVEEARKNLELKKFGTLEGLDSLLEKVTFSNKLILNLPVDLKAKDVPILGGAIASQWAESPIAQKCTYLLIEDKKDFGFLFGQQVDGVLVVSPKRLAEEIIAKRLLEKKSI